MSHWADKNDFWLNPEDLGVYRRGRREHDLFRRSDLLEVVFKITRGAGFGLAPSPRDVVSGMISDWFAVLPATPSQYFERLVLSNELYPGLNSLEGFCRFGDRFAIVTSQPFVAGKNASPVQIREWMEAKGFTKLCDATWFRHPDGIGVFDVGGSNLFADEDGELVPIDVIPVQADGTLLRTMYKALERVR